MRRVRAEWSREAGSVSVNTKLYQEFSANPAQLHYRKIGDRVIKQDSSSLSCS